MKLPLLLLLGIPYLLLSQNHFVESASELGVNHSYGQGVAGGGVSFCDFTGDGLDDLTIATQSGETIHFYQNIGGEFEEIPALIPDTLQAKQILWVDYDNDGDKDLYISTYDGLNKLFSNDGNLQLTNITQAAGLPTDVFNSFGACWGDINRDGWLDIYFTKRALAFSTNQAWLYLNNGDGTFSDFTDYCEVADAEKAAFMPVFVDINNDLWPDIYTAHDKTKINTLLRNNGDFTFSDISQSSGADVQINAMGVGVGDYDNDGDLDIYVSNSPEGNKLLNNSGDETFIEMAASSGVGFYGIGWGANFFDADNDSDLDLYASGMSIGSDVVSSIFYENTGDGLFIEPDANFVADTVSSFGNAIGDFNEDGFPDIFVNNTAPFQSHLWVNTPQNDNSYLKVKLQGIVSNRDGIGAWMKVYVNGMQQVRYTHCGIGFLSQNSETQMFGLGTAEEIDSMHILWPTGHVDKLYQIPVNQTVTIIEGSTTDGEIYIDPVTDISVNTYSPIEENKSFISIMPNPSQGELIINTELNLIRKIQIINQNGSLLFQRNITFDQNQVSLNISLPSGIYFVRAENELGHIQIIKWVILK